MNNDIAISVEHLSKRYLIGGKQRHWSIRDTIDEFLHHPFGIGTTKHDKEEFWALDDVSFEVKKGDVVGIIGRNGSGKSTLLKILARIVEPTKGKVTMRGRVASLLEVGTGFNPELTGRENIYLNGAILGMSRAEIASKFDEIVAFSGVEQFIDTPVKRYSSGMYVRLAFAVAAHLDADILLVDEVLAVGDVEFQKKCLGKMGSLAKSGKTVLFVSHDMTAIQNLCNNTIFIENGQIKMFDHTKKVISYFTSNHSLEVLTRTWNDDCRECATTEIRINEISILNNKFARISQITIDDEIVIQILFNIQTKVESFNFSLIVWSSSGIAVFNTISEICNLEQGKHRGILTIPNNMLNEDLYSVQLIVVNNSQPIINVRDVLTFSVIDKSDIYTDKRIGIVRPKLDFIIK
jgi:lipopolysaccharide transport system ATP-binding protein